ncbi:PepSY domain-containing protein [Methylocystis sp. WRRC1]|uniref:PepSY domain-containing protein n=1 Tax=unclassified Methylocystis TaxID=2625913 RepID=UPI0001F88674|nr:MULTISPECIES: PepSY domain-containing protein [unclassified Methylocystis]MCC3244337.1 PepSY domain-containing protein [Methylocystis sp. WRRC1]
MINRSFSHSLKALALCIGLTAGAASADDLFDILPSTNDSAILPMETILARAHEAAPGTVTEIELERKRGRWVYEVEVLSPNGRKTELLIDARTGQILSQKIERR